MADFAELGIRFLPVGDAEAERALKAVKTGADGVETSTKRMTATMESAARSQKAVEQAHRLNTSALGQMAQAIQAADAQQRAALRATQALDAQVRKSVVTFNDFHDAASRDFAAQYVQQMGAMAAAHGRVAASSKTLTMTTLNLSRQFADVGVQAAMGTAPLMIAIMQGPQIADAFATAKTQGLGFKEALAGMARGAASLIVAWGPLIAGAAAVGGAFMLWRKHADDVKEALEKTAEAGRGLIEVQNATREAFSSAAEFADKYGIASAGLSRAIDAVITSQNAAYAETLAGIDATDAAGRAAVRRAELERLATVAILKRAAADATARAAISQGAVKEARGAAFGSGMIAAIGMGGNMEALRVGQAAEAAKFKALGGEAAAKAAAQELAYAKSLNQSADALMTAKLIIPEVTKAHEGATRAVGRHTGAVKALKEAIDRTLPAVADLSKLVNLDAPASTKAFERGLAELNGKLIQMPQLIDPAVTAMEEFYQAANQAGSGVDQMFNGLKNRDWMSAVSGLLRAAKAVQDAFAKGGTTAGKIGAVAGIADGIGQAVGGTAGSVLSGAAGGAMGGVSLALALGGPVGWIAAAGAAIGGLFGLFGSNSKKQAEKEAAAQAAREAEAQRQAQILQQRQQIELAYVEATGTAIEILAAQRKAELAGIDESNKAMALALYAAQDQKRRDEEGIALMRQLQAMDDAILGTTVALTAAREDELKALDPANRYLAELIYARQDEAAAMEKQRVAAEAATVAADALAASNAAATEALAAQAAANAANDADIASRMHGFQIQLMESMGDSAGATAMKRADTLAGLPRELKVWQEALFGMEDVAAKRAEAEKAQAAAQAAVDTARSALTAAYDRERGALVSMRDEAHGVSDSLRQWSRSLSFSEAGGGNLAQRQSLIMAELARLVRAVQGGDLKAANDIGGMGDAALAVAKDTARTQIEYAREVAKVRNLTEAAAVVADSQVNVAEAQLAALDASVSGLIAINDNVISVRQGIDNLTAALGVQKAAQTAAAVSGMAGGGFSGGSDGTVEPWIAAQIANAAAGGGGMAYSQTGGNVSAPAPWSNFAEQEIVVRKALAASGRTDYPGYDAALGFATGGSFTVGGYGSGDSQNFGPVDLTPGEVVNVSRKDSMADVASALAQLAAEVSRLKAELEKTTANTARTAKASEDSAYVLEGAARGELPLTTENAVAA